MELSITQEELSNRVMKITAACLRVVIQTALSEALGPNWLEPYRKAFNAQAGSGKYAKMDSEIQSIKDFDFQACVKLFAFVSEYRQIVLEKYNLSESNDDIETLSSSLVYFRNDIIHSGEKNGTPMDTYTYEHGITTMKALVSYFPTVKDPQTHKSFLEELNGLTMDFNKQATTKMYPFAKYPQVQKYSNAEIVNACLLLGIRTDYDNKNRLSFFSFDESGDINRIYRQLSGNQSETQTHRNPVQQLPTMPQPAAPAKKASHKKIWVLVGTLIVLVVVLGFFLLFRAVGSLLGNFSQAFFGGSPSVENTTPASLAPAQTEDADQNASDGAADTSEATTAAAAGAGVNQIPQEMRAKVEAVEPRRETLKVGDTHLDNQISFMLESSHFTNMKAYSEDTSIATVDENMIVTAHKKGIVRIVYVYNWVGTETTVIEYVID